MAPGSNRAGGRGHEGAPQAHFRAHGRQAIRARALLSHALGWRRDVAVENIGLGGAGVVLGAEPAAQGDALTITFATPALPAPLTLEARVAWIGPGAAAGRPAGVAFEHASPAAAFALYQMLLAYDPSA